MGRPEQGEDGTAPSSGVLVAEKLLTLLVGGTSMMLSTRLSGMFSLFEMYRSSFSKEESNHTSSVGCKAGDMRQVSGVAWPVLGKPFGKGVW